MTTETTATAQPKNPSIQMPTGKSLGVWIDWLNNNHYQKLEETHKSISELIENELCQGSKEKISATYATPIHCLSQWLSDNIDLSAAERLNYWENIFIQIEELEKRCTPLFCDWIKYLRDCGHFVVAQAIHDYTERVKLDNLKRCRSITHFVGCEVGLWSDTKEGYEFWFEIYNTVQSAESKNL